MKKKIISLCLVVCLLAVAIIGGTLAYFTDTESKTNTFTMGNVNIEIQETFEEGATLLPGVKVPKEVYIKNTGTMDAWVWFTMTYPAAYETSVSFQGNNEPFLYIGYPGATWDAYPSMNTTTDTWHHYYENETDNGVTMRKTFTQDGVEYVRYTSLYNQKLPAGEVSTMGHKLVYLTSLVTQKENEDGTISYYVTDNDEDKKVDWDFATNDYELDIVVDAYAIQDNNYADVYAAWKAFNN